MSAPADTMAPDVFGEDEWDDLIRFDAHDYDVPPFPIGVLPTWLANWCRETSTALQVPVDVPAMLALSVVSMACSKKRAVRVKAGSIEPGNLYTTTILGPGEGKSPPYTAATAPVRAWEREQQDRSRATVADLREQRELLEARLRAARARATKSRAAEAQNAAAEARELAVTLSEMRVPVLPRLLAEDATAEAVGRLLADHGGRMAIFSAEGGPLAIAAGRYSDKGPSLELLCAAYSGDAYTLDRIGRSAIHIDVPLLTIALAVQPSVIAGLAATPQMRGQGLLARFLYSMPRSIVGSRVADPCPVRDDTRAAYERAVERLLDMTATADERGEMQPVIVALSDGAREELIRLKQALEPRLGKDGDLHAIADWGNKLAGTTSRLALVLHVASHVEDGEWSTPIETVTMVKARAIADYSIGHALAAFALMGADPAIELAKRAWDWIQRHRRHLFSKRDLYRALKVGHARDIDPAIGVLTERAYIRPVRAEDDDDEPGRGRPASPEYEVNPAALETSRVVTIGTEGTKPPRHSVPSVPSGPATESRT